MGMPLIECPFEDAKDAPNVPKDITSLNDQDLSKLYGHLDGFASFVGYRLAEAEVRKLDVGRELKDLDAKMMLSGLDGVKKGSVTQKKMEIYLEPELIALRTTEVYHTAEVKLLKSRYEGIERSIRVLSREQSRREADGRRTFNKP